MPYSLKQLDQRYQNACESIKDCKEYTLENLKKTIEINLQDFFDDLHGVNLEKCEAEFVAIEDTIQQCRLAMRNEKSRRSLQDEIIEKTNKDNEKTKQKLTFKQKRRWARLEEATPYPKIQRKDSIEH